MLSITGFFLAKTVLAPPNKQATINNSEVICRFMTPSDAAAGLLLDHSTQTAATQPEDCPEDCQAIRSQIGHLFRGWLEEPWREVVQIAPPGEPLVRRVEAALAPGLFDITS
jgi:hypothetical protein